MGRVCVGTCTGPADAVLVRAALEAHDIQFVINAEHHAGVLGGLGGAFVPLHVFVDEEHAEEAAALLRDLREQDRQEPDDEPDDDPIAAEQLARRVDRRRKIGTILLIVLAVSVASPYAIDNSVIALLLVGGAVAATIATLATKRTTLLPRAQIKK